MIDSQPVWVYVLGFPVDAVSLADAAAWILKELRVRRAATTSARLVVTLNPEIAILARTDARLASALRRAELSVADGVGITWAARRKGLELPGRVPGVDLVTRVLQEGGSDLRVFLLGAKPGVAAVAAKNLATKYGTRVVGTHHGYFDKDKGASAIAALVRASNADLLLAGLGEGQELFLHENGPVLGVKVMIGVGGTIDVLAGAVKRMPGWSSRLGVEWVLRVLLDPKRWGRLPRLWQFAWLVLRRTPT
ncbi:MAG TPA: WecB/TagA/CpsF family glycosyltransferase [Trueperaceae bacterium]|nr:WecB/TagA/CpsF family glycosyltransferase [Trueperaceae bacterium]